MTVRLRQSSGTTQVADLHARTGAGLVDAKQAFVRTVDGLKQFFGQFALSHSGDVGVVVNGSGTVYATTQPVTVKVEGAVGAITYAWTKLTGGAWTINNPAGAETTFSIGVAPGVKETGTFRCTVTDAAGHSGTVEVTATASNLYGGFV